MGYKKKIDEESQEGNDGLAVQGELQNPETEAVKALKGPKRFSFRGDEFDLENLTEAQEKYLREFPEQVPYLGE